MISDLEAKSDCHFDISGATRVLPAPTSGELAPPELELSLEEELPQAATVRVRVSAAIRAPRSRLDTQISLSWGRVVCGHTRSGSQTACYLAVSRM